MSVEQIDCQPDKAPAVREATIIAFRLTRTDAFDKDLMDLLPHMRTFARFLTRDADKATDLVQDTAVRVLRAQHQFKPGTNFRAWVFTVLRNLHINSFRSKTCATLDLDDPGIVVCSVPPNQHAALEFKDLQRALSKLPPEQREVLLLVGAGGFSYEEAAVICGCPIGTIKSRMSRGRDTIFHLLGGSPGEAGDGMNCGEAKRRNLNAISAR